MWYPPVNTKEDARNIALNLDPTGRKLLMEELKIIDEEKGLTIFIFLGICFHFLVNSHFGIALGTIFNGNGSEFSHILIDNIFST